MKFIAVSGAMEHLNLSPSTVSGVVSRLCDNGFLERKNDEKDLRKGVIVQGEKCKELEETLRQSLITTSDIFLKGLSKDKKTNYIVYYPILLKI